MYSNLKLLKQSVLNFKYELYSLDCTYFSTLLFDFCCLGQVAPVRAMLDLKYWILFI